MTRSNVIHPGVRMGATILAAFLAIGTVAVLEGCSNPNVAPVVAQVPALSVEALACGQAIQAAVAGQSNNNAKALAATQVALTNASCIALGNDATNALITSFGTTTTVATPVAVPAAVKP